MTPEEKENIENIVSDIMINDGPDGHCDGSGVITNYIESLLNGTSEQWLNEYFKIKERCFTA